MIRKTLLAAAIAGLALQAQAANVIVNVTSAPFDGGSLIGQTLSGQFSYDDSALTGLTEWLPLSSFSFTVNGQTHTLTGGALDAAAAAFSGGQLVGLEAVALDAGARDYAFVSGFGAPYVFYTTGSDFGAADLNFAPVPEPEGYALMLGGLAVVGFFARRRKA